MPGRANELSWGQPFGHSRHVLASKRQQGAITAPWVKLVGGQGMVGRWALAKGGGCEEGCQVGP